MNPESVTMSGGMQTRGPVAAWPTLRERSRRGAFTGAESRSGAALGEGAVGGLRRGKVVCLGDGVPEMDLCGWPRCLVSP